MYEKLPQELKERGSFCLWKYEERDGRLTKVPYQANGLRADSTNKATFTDYDIAVSLRDKYDGMPDFTEFTLEDNKLAIVLKMDADFLHDNPHIFSNFFIGRMARAFGKAENDGFINGTSVDMPTGILSKNGADIGVTAAELTFDSVIQLYFSVDKNYRDNGVWLMKDDSENYLWNHVNDTILEKPVYINNCMPSAASGAKPVAFGDFSFYWIMERDPLSVRILKEKFIESGQIGYLGYEFSMNTRKRHNQRNASYAAILLRIKIP